MSLLLTAIITLIIGFPIASIVEWCLHKYVLHQRISWYSRPYHAHAEVHHSVFGPDATYHLQPGQDKWIITMAWWSVFALVPLGTVPFALCALSIAWLVGWPEAWMIILTGALVIALYYGAYERLHYCMHAPKGRWFERTWLFRWLNGHHLLHHQHEGGANYCVVFPFADLTFGTWLKRATCAFAQVRGPFIRDVQPV